MDVLPGGDLTKELEYEKHSSAEKLHLDEWQNAVADVACGRAIAFP